MGVRGCSRRRSHAAADPQLDTLLSPPQKAVVIDCRGHMLGRLASTIAKQILNGNTIVRACASRRSAWQPLSAAASARIQQHYMLQPTLIAHAHRCAFAPRRLPSPAAWSGSGPSMSAFSASATTQTRARVLSTFAPHHASSGAPSAGTAAYRCFTLVAHSTQHSMVPHKTKRGGAALDRLKCFEGIPAPYDTVKRMVVPDALKVLRLQHGHRYCKLGDLSASVRACLYQLHVGAALTKMCHPHSMLR